MKTISILAVLLMAAAAQAQDAAQTKVANQSTAAQTTAPANTTAMATDTATVPTASASTSESVPSVSATVTQPTKREDIDKEITNARLRAATGAKSLFSIQSNFNYNGGSIQNPFGQERPQLSPGVVENDPSKITGAVSVKYRATDHDNLNLGVGLGWVTPTYKGQYGQVEDPYIAYGRVFKTGAVQNVLNVQMTKYTADSSVNNGLNFESDIDHTFLVNVGKTKWQLGVDVAWTREFYSTHTDGIQDELAAFPFAEYAFNDTLSFRTVYRGMTYFNTVAAANTFQHDDSTQSMGLGIAVSRDMYFYPNVQWVWADMRSEKTNVALSAYINM